MAGESRQQEEGHAVKNVGHRTENEPRNGNLIPFTCMDEARHRELSVKGGKASGAARRAKRDRIEAAKAQEIARVKAERAVPYPIDNEILELRRAAADLLLAERMMKRGCRP